VKRNHSAGYRGDQQRHDDSLSASWIIRPPGDTFGIFWCVAGAAQG